MNTDFDAEYEQEKIRLNVDTLEEEKEKGEGVVRAAEEETGREGRTGEREERGNGGEKEKNVNIIFI